MSEEEDDKKMRVRLLRDIVVSKRSGGAVAGVLGEEYDIPVADARYLLRCGAVQRVEDEGGRV